MRQAGSFSSAGATLVRLDQVSLCSAAFPRRIGVAAKRSLF